MHPSGTIVFALCATFAVLAAVTVAGLQRASGRHDPEVWSTFGMQLALTALLLVPLALGGVPLALFVIGSASIAAYELYRVLVRPRTGAARFIELALALLVLGVCEWSLLSIAALGIGQVFFYYAVVELNDSFAAIVGRYLGRTPLWPRLSPKKSWEGLVAGLLAAVSVAAALAFLQPGMSRASCALLGLLLALCGVATDLATSALKRRAGVKDFSSLIPHHGGLLDAYDSVLLVAPVFYLLLRVLP